MISQERTQPNMTRFFLFTDESRDTTERRNVADLRHSRRDHRTKLYFHHKSDSHHNITIEDHKDWT